MRHVLLVPFLCACATAQGPGGPTAQPLEGSPAMRTVKRVAVPLIAHNLTPDEIVRRSKAVQAECDQALAATAAVPDADRTFANTLDAMEQAVADYADAMQRLGILKDVHPDEPVRAAAAEAEEAMGKYLVGVASRRDLYRAVKGYLGEKGKTEALDVQQRRLLELALRDFKRNGLELSDKDLARLVELRTRMTTLATEFQRNLNENTDSIDVTQDALAGVPEAVVSRLAKAADGRRVVTTKYPDYVPFMENARSADARRRLYVKFQSRESEKNTPILKEVVRLRDQAAKLLGYATHADYVTEDRMALSAKTVAGFLSSLRERLRPRRDADFKRLNELKRAETGDPKAAVDPWDVAYYFNELKKRDFALDAEAIREYFPAEQALRGMFTVYERLLSIAIREVPSPGAWAPEVKLYEIRDAASGEEVALFYADLYPRKGKYGHAACAPVTLARETPEGYRMPVSVLMANFTPPANGRPSLMTHEEVRTLFHEFGHIMHQTLTTARYASQSGTSVAGDFVEAPSQMLENWVFEKPVLDLLSGHWSDPSKKLPAETIERIRAARMFNAGFHYTRQLFLATFDQALHTSGPEVDPDALDKKLYQEILALKPVGETHFPATFGHLLGGYDAGYYGYLWSEVFAEDMFSSFEKEGILNAGLGRRYRDVILAKGRSAEPAVLLREFLGREPNNEAFLRRLESR